MKANHNSSNISIKSPEIIHKIRQTHFWKQTTTEEYNRAIKRILYTKFVKHTFESKPQHICLSLSTFFHYTQNSSNTLLKANHNRSKAGAWRCNIIHKIRQTHFWKQTKKEQAFSVQRTALRRKDTDIRILIRSPPNVAGMAGWGCFCSTPAGLLLSWVVCPQLHWWLLRFNTFGVVFCLGLPAIFENIPLLHWGLLRFWLKIKN